MNQPDDDRARSAAEYGGRPQPFQPKARATSRWRFIPLVESVRGYSVSLLRVDVLAGVALAALAVPQGMAYAQTAGLPVVAGLYGLLLPLVAYAALGSSRSLMTGPTATSALLVAPALASVSSDPADYPALAAMLALLVGAVFLVARLLRLGWISDYFSAAVLLGFLTGLALTLVSGQLDDFTGVAVRGRHGAAGVRVVRRQPRGRNPCADPADRRAQPHRPAGRWPLPAQVPDAAAGDGGRDRRVGAVGPRRPWRGARRRDPARPADVGVALGVPDRHRPAGPVGGRHRPGRLLRRDPDRPQPVAARFPGRGHQPGAHRACGHQRGCRCLPVVPARVQRLPHRREHPARRTHPGRRAGPGQQASPWCCCS